MNINFFHIIIPLTFFFTFSSIAEYSDEILIFESNENRDLYYSLIGELRCPKCQNQNLLDSNSPLAIDLKNQLYVLVNDDYGKDQIKEYMRSRYGDYILYNPPLNKQTLILWFLPLIIFIFAIILLISKIIKNNRIDKN
tara:strand:+ start:785 stop:1201 length:417 start_codon:yes stop_codon:yes gene_type:complete